MARVGFTTEDTEGTEVGCVSGGHGMTRKFTERENKGIGARGVHHRGHRGHGGFLEGGARPF